MTLRAVISDFGGVLTTPLIDAFLAFQDAAGVAPEDFGHALQGAVDETGVNPLFELEKGRLTEEEFLADLGRRLEPRIGRRPELHRFREVYFDALQPNEPMIALMREAKSAGLRMALLTNNVREWEPLWRSMLPVDEIFEFVVDSAYVGMRKPEAEIYELTVRGFGDGLRPQECLFVDDVEANCEAAAALGLRAVHYRGSEQAAAEIREALRLRSSGCA